MNKILTYRPPRIAFACLAVAAGLHYLSPASTVLHFSYHLLGTVSGLSGFVVMIWAWVLFKTRNNAICPTSRATVLIQSGPYQFTRNPMYLGMLLMLCGAGFLLGSVVAFLAPMMFYVTMNEVFIPFEEQAMEEIFGADYVRYREQVRRWI